jgi:uncharacterized membrane protein YgcG
VLIVPTTAPEEIEQYGIRVVDAWRLGRETSDDGALLLVAKDDHKLRIEVGRGLGPEHLVVVLIPDSGRGYGAHWWVLGTTPANVRPA